MPLRTITDTASGSDSPKKGRIKKRLRFLHLFAFGLIIAVPPALIRPPPVKAAKPESGMNIPLEIDKIRQTQPDFFLIGNSMVETRINVPLLNQLSGKMFYKVSRPGSGSAVWYLFFKNIIGPSGVPAKGAIVFFRDQDLTWPRQFTQGKRAGFFRSLWSDKEPVVEKFIGPADGEAHTPVEQMGNWLQALYPIREEIDLAGKVHDLAMDMTPSGFGKRARRAEMDRMFAVGNLVENDAAGVVAAGEAPSANDGSRPVVFDGGPGQSFLPHMLDVAGEHSVKLYFVLVRHRPDENGIVERTLEDQAYIDDLRVFLEWRGAVLVDETPDRSIPASIYSDGSHIRADAMDWYTRKFWQRMEPVLK